MMDSTPTADETLNVPADAESPPDPDQTQWKPLSPEPVVFDSDPDLQLPDPTQPENTRLEGLAATAAAYRPTIPGYEILGELGRGGMGVVYKARQVRLKRLVALKMILSGPHAGSEELERFITEAEAAARLQHPNIVQIYEVGEHETRPFFSLEYVEGGSLERRLDGKPLPPRAAARLVEALARAMHYAHERGIVHRDLKPANVLLACSNEPRTGQPRTAAHAWLQDVAPKITDFGLAKKLDGDQGQTRTGSILGTPNYMSPEQATGQVHAVGPASDIYALGAILYELLTGRPPFQGESPFDTLRRVANAEPVPPRSLVGGMPRDIETICLKCLHKDPRRRYANALEFARDLRRFQDGETIRARPTPAWERAIKWTRRRPGAAGLLAAVILALLVVAGAGLAWNANLRAEADREAKRRADVEQARAQSSERLVRLTVTNGTRLMDDGDLIGSLPWFAEALRLEQNTPAREDMHRLRLAAVLEQCPQLVQSWFHRSRINAVIFSPDGRRVLTASEDGTAQVWDAVTGAAAPRPLTHGKAVLHAAFSPDSLHVATASADGAARLWRSDTGLALGARLKHPEAVVAVAFSPDGRRLLTACKDGQARLWNVATQELLAPRPHHSAPLTQALFSPDGSRILTAAEDGTVQLWDAESGLPLARPARQRGKVLCVAFSPDGSRFVTASADGIARIWHTATGFPTTQPMRHSGEVLHASFSPDGRLVATAGADQTARVWNAANGQPVGNPFRHGSKVYVALFGPAARRLVTTSDDNTARVWDAGTGESLGPPLKHNGGVTCAAFSPDGRWVATGGLDGMVRLWSSTGGQQHLPPLRHTGRVRDAVFSPDARLVATASEDRTARVWDSETSEPVSPPLRHPGEVNHVAFSSDGNLVATAGQDGVARLWNTRTGELRGSPLVHGQAIRQVDFRPGNEQLVTAGEDGTARIWEVATGKLTVRPLKHAGPITSACFSPDGWRVLTASLDGTARLWNANTGEPLAEFKHEDAVNYAAFSPNGRLIVTANSDHTARLWDATTGKSVGQPMRHGSPVTHAAFGPDGSRLITASDDDTARVWNAESCQPVTPPLHHMGTVRRVAFSPNGRLVTTASDDGTARVWDAVTGEAITPALQHHGPATDVAFAPSGTQLVTAGPHAARLWRLPREDRPIEDIERVAQVLAVGQIDATGGLVALERDALQTAWRELQKNQPDWFDMAKNESAGWHRREIEECEMCADWYGAAWHLDRLLAAQPRDARLFRLRGNARAGMGEWQRALHDYTRAVELAPQEWEARLQRGVAHAHLRQWQLAAADFARNRDEGTDDPHVWRYFALANLAAGNSAAYRAACADLLERFGPAADPETAREVVWTASLAPRAVTDASRLVEVATRAQKSRPRNPRYLLTLGAALLRAGKPAEAIEKLEAALPNSGDHATHALLLLTLACQQSGKGEEARRWFDQTAEALNEPGQEQGTQRSWDHQLELEILRAEAEAYFKHGKP
jgi:WD40 repeat protein/serine/threonine protein kinase/tetratricopeptide (TPR) repeat protein